MCDKADEQSKHHKQCIESPTVVWLDSRFEDELFYQATSISALQQAGQSVKTFANTDTFVDFITDMEDEKVTAVTSDEFCQTILSSIHDLPQIISFYIFYQDNQMTNNDWQKNFYKVHSTFNDVTTIVDSLKRETRIIEHNLEHISILECSTKLDLNNIDPDFMYLQTFKELILEIDHDAHEKQEFAEYCYSYCDNPASLRVIDEIRRNYEKHSPACI